jgi:hypothetical protein
MVENPVELFFNRAKDLLGIGGLDESMREGKKKPRSMTHLGSYEESFSLPLLSSGVRHTMRE